VKRANYVRDLSIYSVQFKQHCNSSKTIGHCDHGCGYFSAMQADAASTATVGVSGTLSI
jgi:hypothetical protein